MPPDFGVYEMLEDNLKKMGFSQVSVLALYAKEPF